MTLERYYSWIFTDFLLWEFKLGYTVLDTNQVRRLVRYKRTRLGNNNLIYLIWMRSMRRNRLQENLTGNLDKQSHRELSNHRRCPAKRQGAQRCSAASLTSLTLQGSSNSPPLTLLPAWDVGARVNLAVEEGKLKLISRCRAQISKFLLFSTPALC